MEYRWQFAEDPVYLQEEAFLTKILLRRGIPPDQWDIFLDPLSYTPRTPQELPGIEAAVSRLRTAQEKQEKVVVYGDFTCDGVTATAVLVEALRAIGVPVTYTIPHRREGHGLHRHRVEDLADAGTQVIITSDCGIGDRKAVDRAKELGIDVIIIDHHSLPAVLPTCTAIVNPLLLSNEHPLFHLSGVGVAYKLAEALWEKADLLLDLVAIGLISDITVLCMENRYLWYRGLEALRSTQRLGLQYFLKDKDIKTITAKRIGSDLGSYFHILGRLEEASLGIDFLLSTDPDRVVSIGNNLIALNETYKHLTEITWRQAEAFLARQIDRPRGIVLHHPEWHSEVLDTVATELQKTYECPVILIAGNGYTHARSWNSVSLERLFIRLEGLIEGLGGHPRARSFVVPSENIPLVRDRLQVLLTQEMLNQQKQKVLPIEGVLPITKKISPRTLENLYQQVARLEPFGEGNPAPIFVLTNIEINKDNPEEDFSGEHLCFSVLGKKFWWYEAVSKSKLLEGLQRRKVDIAFQFAPDPRQGWRGVVLDVRRSFPLRSLFVPTVRTLEVIDVRHQNGNLPDQSITYTDNITTLSEKSSLFLSQIPYSSLHLQTILQRLQPAILYLGGQKTTLEGQLTEKNTEIPSSLTHQWRSHYLFDTKPNYAWQEIVSEVLSFQDWFLTAPIETLTLLCERLAR